MSRRGEGGTAPAAERGGAVFTAARLVDAAIVWSAAAVAVASTLALFASVGLAVVTRYTTGRTAGWTAEMPNLLFPWLTVAGIVLAAQFGRHIVVELLVRLLPPAAARAALMAIQLVVAAMFAYLAWTGLTILQVTSGERFPVTRIAAYWAYLSIVVGFTMLAVTALTSIARLASMPGDPFQVRTDEAIGGET